jgi:quercetin dioxygenase-like cupin family protein
MYEGAVLFYFQTIYNLIMKYRSLDLITATGVSHNPEISKKVLIENGEIPHITQLARVTFKPGQTANSHEHKDMYEIFNIESGSGKILIDSSEYQLRTGDCFIVEPNESHEIQNSSQEDLIITILGLKV